ncbi:hypothetical protein FOZ63_005895 [Perkinsus olseni]|uniref:EF-hand domain-containing protein n=1 Tax=Perkinsus olseni TaxID=32597 RepID=A0A7J6S8S8_PEROL|nr:hypothetical protein FOZ62_026811 [Perkinsus olseni]KAF4746362.1 hypothetical protein FOZ63_005895 [Perkinsus olseni]
MFIPPGGYGFQFNRIQQQQQQVRRMPSAGGERLFSAPTSVVSGNQTVRTTSNFTASSPMPPPPFTPAVAAIPSVPGVTHGVVPSRSATPDNYLAGCATPMAPPAGASDVSAVRRYHTTVATPSSGAPQQRAVYSPLRGLCSSAAMKPAAASPPLRVETQVEKIPAHQAKVEHGQTQQQQPQQQRRKMEPEKSTRRPGGATRTPTPSTGPPRVSEGRRFSAVRKVTAKVAAPEKVTKPPQLARRAAKRTPPLIELSPPKKLSDERVAAVGEQGKVELPEAAERRTTGDAQLDQLKDMRRTVQLRDVPIGKALRHFAGQCMKAGCTEDTANEPAADFTPQTFTKAYRSLLEACGIASKEDDEQIERLFALFDRDKNGRVDLMEVICGLSLICSGTEKEKLEGIFDIFDADGDGRITLHEMTTFLRNVYRIVLTPLVAERMKSVGVSLTTAEALAAVTAKECFANVDSEGSGTMSCNDFHRWFCTPQKHALFVAGSMDGLFN